MNLEGRNQKDIVGAGVGWEADCVVNSSVSFLSLTREEENIESDLFRLYLNSSTKH